MLAGSAGRCLQMSWCAIQGSCWLCSLDSLQLRCLAPCGIWVRFEPLQLDPPESRQLLLKNCRLAMALEQTWLLSGAQLGRYRRVFSGIHAGSQALSLPADMLQEVGRLVAAGTLRPSLGRQFPLEKAREAVHLAQMARVGQVLLKP